MEESSMKKCRICKNLNEPELDSCKMCNTAFVTEEAKKSDLATIQVKVNQSPKRARHVHSHVEWNLNPQLPRNTFKISVHEPLLKRKKRSVKPVEQPEDKKDQEVN